MMKPRVICAISGGIDSAVSAHLLKSKGFQVEGIFMKNWDLDADITGCTSDFDHESAVRVCKKLEVPLHKANFVKEYWTDVFQNMLDELKRGRSPNIDVYCNRFIKFGHLIRHIKSRYDVDYLATGHYATMKSLQSPTDDFPQNSALDSRKFHICMSKDSVKDQTFFLSNIQSNILNRLIFPVGNFTKEEVKCMAVKIGMPWLLGRKSSRGICFVGNKGLFGKFLTQNFMPQLPGKILEIDSENHIGNHDGFFTYTIGQSLNKGIFQSNSKTKRYFVVKKDAVKNEIYVCKTRCHPLVMKSRVNLIKVNILNFDLKQLQDSSQVIYYKSQSADIPYKCRITDYDQSKKTLNLSFDQADGPMASGQTITLYTENCHCIGCGEID